MYLCRGGHGWPGPAHGLMIDEWLVQDFYNPAIILLYLDSIYRIQQDYPRILYYRVNPF